MPMHKKLRVWWMSIIRAAISGAAGGVLNGFAAVGIKPDVFNFDRGLKDLITMAGIAAIISAVVGVAGYLQRSPLPDEEDAASAARE